MKIPLSGLFVLFCLCVLFCLPVLNPARAGQCLSDSKMVAVDGQNLVRLKDYYCRGAHGPAVRVQFHRLSDFLASSMLEGKLPSSMQNVLGRARFLRNDVYETFAGLMNRHGTVMRNQCEFMQIGDPKSGNGWEGRTICDGKYRGPPRRTFGGWGIGNFDNPIPTSLASPNDYAFIKNTGRFPPGFVASTNGEYGWRYMTAQDLVNYESKIAAFNRQLGADQYGRIKPSNYIGLLQEVTRDFFPPDFVVVVGAAIEEGCGEETLTFLLRPLLVDVVAIENISSGLITLSDLAGTIMSSNRLRPLSVSQRVQAMRPGRLGGNSVQLAPGEKLVLFQRLTFIASDSQKSYFNSPYLPFPSKPSSQSYVYGPEMHVKGFSVDGEPFDLAGNAANFVSLTAGAAGGSCPFLYAWSDTEDAWVNEGKILDKAKGKGQEQAESRSFDGFVSKFRLTEEEAEIAHINQVRLTIETNDGTSYRLKPDNAVLAGRDKAYERLYFGNLVEFSFSLPKGVLAGDVKSSTLTAVGYYERYADLQRTSFLQKACRVKRNQKAAASRKQVE